MGRGFESFEEYLESLSILWEEQDKYYGQRHVCIPVLCSCICRIGEHTPTQQELVDIIIYSYTLVDIRLRHASESYARYALIILYQWSERLFNEEGNRNSRI